MKERPILFSGEMVRAILDGRKTMTRRVVKFKEPFSNHSAWPYVYNNKDRGFIFSTSNSFEKHMKCENGKMCPYGTSGDRLWVRETWRQVVNPITSKLIAGKALYLATEQAEVIYDAGDGSPAINKDGSFKSPWKSSRFMPRWASRITLEIVNVRAERLQDVTREDAKKEGFCPSDLNGLESWNGKLYGNAQLAFEACWQDINGKKHPWSSNPWVWVMEFKKI